jgi:hypothetical protein
MQETIDRIRKYNPQLADTLQSQYEEHLKGATLIAEKKRSYAMDDFGGVLSDEIPDWVPQWALDWAEELNAAQRAEEDARLSSWQAVEFNA